MRTLRGKENEMNYLFNFQILLYFFLQSKNSVPEAMAIGAISVILITILGYFIKYLRRPTGAAKTRLDMLTESEKQHYEELYGKKNLNRAKFNQKDEYYLTIFEQYENGIIDYNTFRERYDRDKREEEDINELINYLNKNENKT